MKRRTGAAKARETLAETRMREAAAQMASNRYNYGSKARKGAPTRGKRRGTAFKPTFRR